MQSSRSKLAIPVVFPWIVEILKKRWPIVGVFQPSPPRLAWHSYSCLLVSASATDTLLGNTMLYAIIYSICYIPYLFGYILFYIPSFIPFQMFCSNCCSMSNGILHIKQHNQISVKFLGKSRLYNPFCAIYCFLCYLTYHIIWVCAIY